MRTVRTDKQIIEAAKNVGIYTDADLKRLVELAEAGLDKQPPEGAVKVQLAVVCGVGGKVISLPCGNWESPAAALNAARSGVGLPTHAAIVTAWLPLLPPVQTLEVEGICSR